MRRSLLALAVFVCTGLGGWPGDIHAATRVALVIGNGAYENQSVLPNPVSDAADISESLKRLGFAVTTLTNARDGDMRRALVDFGRAAQGADIAVVFYAGHGMEIGGENWLLPINVRLLSDTDAESEAISLRSVSLQVGKARQLGLVILDACRNNPFAAKMQRSLRTRAVVRGLAATEPTDNVLVAYAAKDGTVANDGDGRNSPFTAALLRHLETPGLEVTFLFRNVRDDVMRATGREQQPFVYGSLSSTAIYLKPAATGDAASAPSQPAAQAWDAVKDSRDPAAIESFLRYYPDGFYADLARARLVELKRQPAVAALGPARALTGSQGSEPTVQFGGPPYCRYSVALKNLKINATVGDNGVVSDAKLTLQMVESSVPPCPFAPLGTKPHSYVGSGQVQNGRDVTLDFTPMQGNSPMANATFRGTVVDGRLVGVLSLQRTDIGGNLAWKANSQFR